MMVTSWSAHFLQYQSVSPGDESRMRVNGKVQGNVNRIATAVLALQMLIGLTSVPALAAGKSETLTGEVSDAMCGAKHEMQGKAADCTRACMKHGSKYALVVGDKFYTLETPSNAPPHNLHDPTAAD